MESVAEQHSGRLGSEYNPIKINHPLSHLVEHHWYQGSRPGGCLSIDCSRCDQITLTCFLSGHIGSLTFSDNSKCFEICPKWIDTPDRILACLGLAQQDLVSNPLLTLDFFRVHRLMDLI
ncbi:hypothetical protein AVEN_131304-1 [Araneus ventricosus]|uniref:Uncharacterized protein n=1 Tax=Araneus ventricosus TaxID=182803 RepID=A0A4Y2VGV6_ARAVE|nr:hypothetical protein AVEN_131304-1 [Araneus ventricosus]